MKVKGLNDYSLFAVITKEKSEGKLFVDENSVNKDFWGVKIDCSNGDIGFGDICQISNDCPGIFWRRVWHDILRLGKGKVVFCNELFGIEINRNTLLGFVKNRYIDFISEEVCNWSNIKDSKEIVVDDKEIIDKSYFENIPNIRLLGDKLLVRPVKKQEYKLESRLTIPDYYRTQSIVGFVLGKSKNINKVNIGDKVIWIENCGENYKDDLILSECQLLGTIIG